MIVAVPIGFLLVPACSQSCTSLRIVLPSPVQVRVIQVQLDAVPSAGIGQLFDDVPFERCSVHGVVCAGRRLEEREAVVVACGDGDVLCAGCLYRRYPCVGIELGGIECFCQLGVFPVVDVPVCHHPFARTDHRVESPMQEDAELLVLELFACLEVLCCRLVRFLCHAAEAGQQGGNQ